LKCARAMTRVPSARLVVPLLALFWLLVALAALGS
jgi:hypothetical protein